MGRWLVADERHHQQARIHLAAIEFAYITIDPRIVGALLDNLRDCLAFGAQAWGQPSQG